MFPRFDPSIVPEAAHAILEQYAQAVIQSNEMAGLTSAKDVSQFWPRHIGDGVAISHCLAGILNKEGTKVIDVGSGNGVPGLVIAVLNPHVRVTLLDSSNKKCLFLEAFLNSASLTNCMVRCARAEEQAHQEREAYNLAISRALAHLPTALELMAGFVNVGGHVVVSRGTKEGEPFENAAKELGLGSPDTIRYEVGSIPFVLSNFPKEFPTPNRYPRRVGVPSKRPL